MSLPSIPHRPRSPLVATGHLVAPLNASGHTYMHADVRFCTDERY
jgi:hypothetical protein